MENENGQVIAAVEETAPMCALTPNEPEVSEDIALLRQIRDGLEEQNKQSKKQIRLLRTSLIAVALIALVAVIGIATLLPSLYQMVDNINTTVTALDMKQIDEIIGNVQVVAAESSRVVDGMSTALVKVNGLDFAALNDTIVSLKTTVEDFSKLDIASLNAAITNLNETVEPFAKFFSKFN